MPGKKPPSEQPALPDDPVLGAVVAEVNTHIVRLDDHQDRMMAYEVAIGEVKDGLGELDKKFVKLTKKLDEVPAAVCWTRLDNQAALKAWGALRAWVEDVLVARYPHVTVPSGGRLLPPCWYLHPFLVEELSALHLAWQHAYLDPTAAATAPVDWHRRLTECQARVSQVVKCANGHNDDPPASEPADEGFGAFVAADVAARPDPPAPPTTPTSGG